MPVMAATPDSLAMERATRSSVTMVRMAMSWRECCDQRGCNECRDRSIGLLSRVASGAARAWTAPEGAHD
jgi:hypothetical protein